MGVAIKFGNNFVIKFGIEFVTMQHGSSDQSHTFLEFKRCRGGKGLVITLKT